MVNNEIKRINYSHQKTRLKIALESKFYVEAIAIEYVIIEDRINSIFAHTNQPFHYKDGKPYKFQKRLDILKDNPFFTEKEMRKRLPRKLLLEIEEWKESRNKIIHNLLNEEFESGEFRRLATKGKKLLDQIDNKSRSIKDYMKKLAKE